MQSQNKQISLHSSDLTYTISFPAQATERALLTVKYVMLEYGKKAGQVVLKNKVGQEVTPEDFVGGYNFIYMSKKDQVPQNLETQTPFRYQLTIQDNDTLLIQKFKEQRRLEQNQLGLKDIEQLFQQSPLVVQNNEFVAPLLSPEELGKRYKVPVKGGQMAYVMLERKSPVQKRGYTKEEIMKHNSEFDAWTVINGKVYDLSLYMDYHPGGREKLMLGAGKDCTSLFNQFHSWVNAHAFLEKDHIGHLVNK